MKIAAVISFIIFTACSPCSCGAEAVVIPPAPVLSPREALDSFQIESGFQLELVASEPLIHNPVSIAFDEQGRLWCVEMRSYMLDMNGKDEEKPIGVISLLHDDDGDGTADRATPFLSDLVLPRTVRPVEGGILFIDDTDLWFVENVQDKAGKRTLVYKGFCKGRNMESKSNGLIYGLDNWYYSADCDFRVRCISKQWVVEPCEKRGQWGISQDDSGRLYTNNNSNNFFAELVPPHYLYRNSHYRKKTPFIRGENRIYPSRPNTGVNRGYQEGMLDDQGRLKSFTAASGLTVYRGNNFPEKYYGSVFVPEPAAQLVKLNFMTWENGKASTSMAYSDREFLTCQDERSRMVNSANAPDGTLYLVDLYHGMLQHAMHLTDYLKGEMISRKLDHPTNLGRIYRVRWIQKQREKEINLNTLSSSELAQLFAHSSSWYREEAHRMIVEKQLKTSKRDLIELTQHKKAHVRNRALWALEGLQALDENLLIDKVSDSDPQVVLTALFLLSKHPIQQKELVLKKLHDLSLSADEQLTLSLAFTLGSFEESMDLDCLKLLSNLITKENSNALLIQAALSGLSDKEHLMFDILPNESHPLFNPLLESLIKIVPKNALHQNLIKHFEAANRKGQFIIATLNYIANSGISLRDKGIVAEVIDWLGSEKIEKEVADKVIKSMLKVKGSKPPIPLDTAPLNYSELLKKIQDSDLNQLFSIGKPTQYINSEKEKEQYERGRQQYLKLCSACHQEHGLGAEALAPPLDDSTWVVGNKDVLISIALNGVSGPIHVSDKLYQAPNILPVMPGFRFNPDITDEHLADVLTYVRNSWSNNAETITANQIAHMRKRLYKTKEPFTEEQLLKFDY